MPDLVDRLIIVQPSIYSRSTLECVVQILVGRSGVKSSPDI